MLSNGFLGNPHNHGSEGWQEIHGNMHWYLGFSWKQVQYEGWYYRTNNPTDVKQISRSKCSGLCTLNLSLLHLPVRYFDIVQKDTTQIKSKVIYKQSYNIKVLVIILQWVVPDNTTYPLIL